MLHPFDMPPILWQLPTINCRVFGLEVIVSILLFNFRVFRVMWSFKTHYAMLAAGDGPGGDAPLGTHDKGQPRMALR
jgi:hypothetical protein